MTKLDVGADEKVRKYHWLNVNGYEVTEFYSHCNGLPPSGEAASSSNRPKSMEESWGLPETKKHGKKSMRKKRLETSALYTAGPQRYHDHNPD
ncbi:hypothetical protein TNCV_4661311 [Trichonephila clavipes]|uniref:Uncharacterized protein n=1 Tax=Trichonephila clavipes TaxID=2585209 RepID=A0A8X6S8Q2_TRICX|nr:hypothetical protein TNCV_4661311 [Trichonephila clavipes]